MLVRRPTRGSLKLQSALRRMNTCGIVPYACRYYKASQIKLSAPLQPTPAPATEAATLPHESFFAFGSALKCTGSKRKRTWSCSTTLASRRAPSETTGTVAGGCGAACARTGEAGWQGAVPAPISSFNTTSTIAVSTRILGKTMRDAVGKK